MDLHLEGLFHGKTLLISFTKNILFFQVQGGPIAVIHVAISSARAFQNIVLGM